MVYFVGTTYLGDTFFNRNFTVLPAISSVLFREEIYKGKMKHL